MNEKILESTSVLAKRSIEDILPESHMQVLKQNYEYARLLIVGIPWWLYGRFSQQTKMAIFLFCRYLAVGNLPSSPALYALSLSSVTAGNVRPINGSLNTVVAVGLSLATKSYLTKYFMQYHQLATTKPLLQMALTYPQITSAADYHFSSSRPDRKHQYSSKIALAPHAEQTLLSQEIHAAPLLLGII